MSGEGNWGQAINLSETGMAFAANADLPKGALILIELSLPVQAKPLRLFAHVIHSEALPDREQKQLRVKFDQVAMEERFLLSQHILQTSDPKLAALSGWGKALFEGVPYIEAHYRQLDAEAEKAKLSDKSFITWKEVSYLQRFQLFLELFLGAKIPSGFKLIGSRPLKDQAPAWIELNLEAGRLHVMGKVLWCSHDPGDKAEMGLNLIAVKKDEAVKLEKGA